ncbi:hypothetical protein Cni_G06276 [Canna indica]|uniref:Reverse transcriptase domain-containing protein n=1 Tax=Canna indica TaxID=4628 RepID=A0AAQ3Q4L5_9LILI|nr:hypothetical protein Cni_G06276 [Canna indica]
MEGFNFMMHRMLSSNNCRGIKLGRHGPEIASLFFADDVMLFSKADLHHASCFNDLLKQFERINGQQINTNKSSIFFSQGTPRRMQNQIGEKLNIPHIGGHDRYLGLPSLINKSKKETFDFILSQIRGKMESWSSQFLSRAGETTLIKSVLATIANYTVSCFYISDSLYHQIDNLCSNFWWSSNPQLKGIHWAKWSQLCTEFMNGGLGFKECRRMNLELLAKIGWRILAQPASLLSRTLKSKYFNDSSTLSQSRSKDKLFMGLEEYFERSKSSK